jgi:hypothetical protein
MNFHLPVNFDESHEVALSHENVSANVAASLQALGIARALGDLRADDVVVTIDQTPERLHVSVRAYRNRS